MAVGARGGAILEQFLIEAVLLSGIGGGIGILLGVSGSAAVAMFAHWPMVVPATAIVLSFLCSTLIGVFFGFYPASKAAHLSPIDALRFE